MKILWVADHNLTTRPAGGAELTDFYMIEYGKSLGIFIDYCLPSTFSTFHLENYDFILLSNNAQYSDSDRSKIFSFPYVVYCHDFQGWKYIFKSFPLIFHKSKLSIFLSPLHKQAFGEVPGECVPPYFPPEFKNLGNSRISNSVMYAGNLWGGLKGANNLFAYILRHQNYHFYLYFHRFAQEWKDKLSFLSNVTLVGYVPHDKIYLEMNKYEYFIHLPGDVEAFGRAVAEAYLSGCKIITNQFTGAFSYPWSSIPSYFRFRTSTSPKLFWNLIFSHVK